MHVFFGNFCIVLLALSMSKSINISFIINRIIIPVRFPEKFEKGCQKVPVKNNTRAKIVTERLKK